MYLLGNKICSKAVYDEMVFRFQNFRKVQSSGTERVKKVSKKFLKVGKNLIMEKEIWVDDVCWRFGVEALSEYQVEAIKCLLDQKDFFVIQPTGSGKCLVFLPCR